MATTARSFKNLVGGQWVDAAGGETFESVSPATGEPIGVFPRSGAEDVDRAVIAAKEAYTSWRLVPAPKRGEIVFRFAASTARSTSSGPDFGNVPIGSPVAGLVLSKVSPETASTHSPPMKFLKFSVAVVAMGRA